MNQSDRSTFPILILGLGRSGSTVLCEVLNAHSRIHISDESWLFYRAARDLVDMGWKPRLRSRSGKQPPPFVKAGSDLGLRRAGPILLGEVPIDVDASVAKAAWRDWLHTIYSFLANRHHAARYGDKCPGAAPFADTIDDILDEHCLYLWTVRHPIDLVLSWIERWRDPAVLRDVLSRVHDVSQFRPTRGDAIRAVLQAYLVHTVHLRRLLSECPSRVLVCPYEKLVAEPDRLLSEVHAFLGESLEKDQIAQAFSGRRQVSGGDPKFNQTDRIHGQSIDRWKRLSQPELAPYLEAVEEFRILECMNFLGYTDAAAELSQALGQPLTPKEAGVRS